MDKHRAAELLEKYRAGICTPQEKLLIEAWYVWEAQKNEDTQEVIPLQAKAKIWESISIETKPVSQNKWNVISLLRIAASVLIVAAVSYYSFTITRSNLTQEIGKLESISTRNGEVKKFLLPDSSSVTLNAGSRIRYNVDFSKREIFLDEGEAFFDVKHDTARPFEVKAASTTTTVLGTAFGVRAYSSMKNIRVTVARGKVSVANTSERKGARNPAYLLPNDQLTFDQNTNTTSQTKIDAQSYMAWLSGVLRFDNERLGEIGIILEKKFGIPVVLSEKTLGEKHLSASFGADDNLDYILEGICLAEDLTFKKQANGILISKKKKDN
jgi:transmembrane sensor